MSGTDGTGAPGGEPLLVDVRDGVARITLNRPDRFNALDIALARLFRTAVEDVADRSDVRVMVLGGAGRAFCGGGDVRMMATAPDRREAMRELVEEMHSALALLSELSLVVVSAVHGVVAGGGIGLMLAGDLVVAERGTRFVSAYDGIGVTPDCGASVLLPEAVGLARALDFTLSGRVLTADEACAWGLVSEVVEEGALPARTEELVGRFLSSPAAGHARRLLRAARLPDFRERLDAEATQISELVGSDRAGELISRFGRQ